jgi:hypothetical protein
MKTHNPFATAILLILLIGVLTILTACGQHSFDERSSFTDGSSDYDEPSSSSSRYYDPDEDDDSDVIVNGEGGLDEWEEIEDEEEDIEDVIDIIEDEEEDV